MKKLNLIKCKISKYEHIKWAFWIFVIMIFVLIASLIVPSGVINSILTNIFAGLITGLVITMIGGVKSKSLKDREIICKFYDTIINYNRANTSLYFEYRKIKNEVATEYEPVVYELVCEMANVEGLIESADKNPIICRNLGKKPSLFFSEDSGYDIVKQKKTYDELMEVLNRTMNYNKETRDMIDKKINDIRRSHHILNRKVYKQIDLLEGEKLDIERSII